MISRSDRNPGFGVVILAAGASRRMGRPKALLPWRGNTILGHLTAVWKTAGARRIAVVYDPQNNALVTEMDRLSITDRIANTDPQQGMMSSARAAAVTDWFSDLAHVAIALVDQPQIPARLIVRLAEFAREHPDFICQPEHNGKRGHPVFFPKPHFRQIADSRQQTLRDFIRSRSDSRKFLACESPAVLADLDTPEAYEEALREEGSTDYEDRFH
jgi:CTP:molybdopterin cytidylyltransferase MocA